MASRGSHRACKRCHTGRVDKRAGLEMCRPCREIVAREQRQARAAVKQRRLARAEVLPMSEDKNLAEPDLSPEVIAAEINVGTIPEPRKGGRQPGVALSHEQKVEVARLYVETDTPIKEIAETYGIHATYPYQVLSQLKISWRRGDSQPAPVLVDHTNGTVKPEIVDQVPEDVVKALERMVKMPEVAARPEPIRALVAPPPQQPVPTAPSLPEYVERVLPSTGDEQVWMVSYEGHMLVRASSIEQALELARADGHIRVINGVTRHTR